MISTRILLGLAHALFALLLFAGVVEREATLHSAVGITSNSPLKAPGKPNGVLPVRTLVVAGVSKERDENRPALGPAERTKWAADRSAAAVIMPPGSFAGPRSASCRAPTATGPPLA